MRTSETLKTTFPTAFSDFWEWFSTHSSIVEGDFHDLPFMGQVGYLIQYLYKKGAKLQTFHPLLSPPDEIDSTDPLWIIGEFVKFSFKQIEYHLNTYFDAEDNTGIAQEGAAKTSFPN